MEHDEFMSGGHALIVLNVDQPEEMERRVYFETGMFG